VITLFLYLPLRILQISIPTPVNLNLNCSLSDYCFSEQDVLRYIYKLRPDKAAGADKIYPWFLFQLKDCISYPLFLLFRKSLDECVVPTDWKCANISPIYKKGSKNKNIPVSLTSQICKLFESVIRDSVVH